MSTPAFSPAPHEGLYLTRRQILAIPALSALVLAPFLIWPRLLQRLLASDFLPHAYCYLRNPGLVWTHVVSDALIGTAYLSISITLAYLVHKARRDIPFHWILLAFGLFIVACGGTHFLEVVTVWIPVYVFSAVVKIFTALASVTTAAVLPFVVPQVLALVQKAKASEQATVRLRASEERKEALLREVHHRVKNNLAVICSLFYLQSTHTEDAETVQIFQDMENRVHSMALVHEGLYRSENLARINFAEYAQALVNDMLSSYGSPAVPVRLRNELEPVIMSVDLAIPCGLILNELISNAFRHGFPDGAGGEIKVTLRSAPGGACTLCVEDTGVGIPRDLDVGNAKSLGLRLVRSLTHQIRGVFELVRIASGTSAQLQFTVDQHVP
jgi:two-component sensor histidine kinase